MTYTQESLYQLTPQEFELICAEIIGRILPIENIKLNDRTQDLIKADIVGTLNGELALVEIKHKLKITSEEITQVFDRLSRSPSSPKHIVLMTSALLSDIDLSKPYGRVGFTCHYIGANDILRVLNSSDVGFIQLRQSFIRAKKLTKTLLLSTFTFLITLGSLLFSIYSIYNTPSHDNESNPLEKRIKTVESALNSLNDLENQLKYIKGDIINTQKAKEAIDEQYKKAEELKALTAGQLESVKQALQFQSLQDSIIQNILSFVLGVASSILGTILLDKYRQKRALES